MALWAIKSIPTIALYVSIIADDTSVSTFLCTRTLEPEEVSVTTIKVHRSLMKLKYSFKDDFLMSETQQLIILTCYRFLHHLYTVSLLYTTVSISCTFFLNLL